MKDSEIRQINRRAFIEFLGLTGVGLGSFGVHGFHDIALGGEQLQTMKPLSRSSEDLFRVADGLRFSVLIRWGDVINKQGESFGINNDYTACLAEHSTSLDAILWVNHESPDLNMQHEGAHLKRRTRQQVEIEQKSVGGSILKIRRKSPTSPWVVDLNSPINRRLTGETPIPFEGGLIAGQGTARGTIGNCSGGVTPWGTVLTCEENTEDYYGRSFFDSKSRQSKVDPKAAYYGWIEFFKAPPEHYGWVVEVNPKTGSAKKLISLGRFAHEGALVTKAAHGNLVVYMGDDANNQCVYKFVSDRSDSLATGTLWVAQIDQGRWLPLDVKKNPKLRETFKNQVEMLTFVREAAAIVGGTPLDRPEGIAQHPRDKSIFVSLTNNFPKGRPFGSILKIEEKGADPGAIEFKSSTFLAGGLETGFACPDNIVFDARGNLWITTDISGSALNKAPFDKFGNNGLYVVPAKGPSVGQAILVATAPVGAELTGPSFSPDFKTLFLSVQHPGEGGSFGGSQKDPLRSQWPDGGKPRCAVVAVEGPLLEALTQV